MPLVAHPTQRSFHVDKQKPWAVKILLYPCARYLHIPEKSLEMKMRKIWLAKQEFALTMGKKSQYRNRQQEDGKNGGKSGFRVN